MPQAAAFDAERIADHRPLYLEYQGPLSEGRGNVSRVAQGRCLVELETPRELMVICAFDEIGLKPHLYRGEVTGVDALAGYSERAPQNAAWRFLCDHSV